MPGHAIVGVLLVVIVAVLVVSFFVLFPTILRTNKTDTQFVAILAQVVVNCLTVSIWP